MTPYFTDGTVTIYHGDCAVIAPQLGAFDLLCTDPPYGIGEARNNNKSRGPRHEPGQLRKSKAIARDYGKSDWDDVPPSAWLIEMLRARSSYQCIFGGNYFSLPPSTCWLVWDKENGENDFADCELAWTNYGTAVRRKRHLWHGMLRKDNEHREHPTQKPLAVMSWAIGLCPVRPTTVFDPFMGSGTTLRACKDLGIQCVGIEREERYCEIAARRMSQQTLFAAEACLA